MLRTLRQLLLTLSCCAVLSAGQLMSGQPPAAVKDQTAATEPLRTAGDRPFDIQHIKLALRVDLPKKTVEGTATLRVKGLRALQHISLDAVDFEIKKVSLADSEHEAAPLRFHHDGKKLIVDLDSAWPTGPAATLQVDYRV